MKDAPPPAKPCPIPSCRERIPVSSFACPPHWGRVPAHLKDLLGKHYTKGQGVTTKPTAEWNLAAKEAIAAVMKREGST